jgi:hypothetical protein
MPYVVKALLGTGGVVGILLLLFMSLTSTLSSSMIGVSSIFSFDIYKTYLNPQATDKQVVHASHWGVVGHAVIVIGVTLGMNYGGANLTWVSYCMPVMTCPGIFPMMFTLLWSRQTKLAAVIAPPLGLATGVALWLGTAKSLYGHIDLQTTIKTAPALYGAMGSLFSPILYSVVISLIWPSRFDWREFLRIELIEDATTSPMEREKLDHLEGELKEGVAHATGIHPAVSAFPESTSSDSDTEKKGGASTDVSAVPESPSRQSLDDVRHPLSDDTLAYLRHYLKIAWAILAVIILVTWLLFPMPLYRDYVFPKAFFSGWVTVAICWQFFALGAVVIFPVWDGRRDLWVSVQGLRKTLRLGGKEPVRVKA